MGTNNGYSAYKENIVFTNFELDSSTQNQSAEISKIKEPENGDYY